MAVGLVKGQLRALIGRLWAEVVAKAQRPLTLHRPAKSNALGAF